MAVADTHRMVADIHHNVLTGQGTDNSVSVIPRALCPQLIVDHLLGSAQVSGLECNDDPL